MTDPKKHEITLSQAKGFGTGMYIADCSCQWYAFCRSEWEREDAVKEHLEEAIGNECKNV